MLHVLDGDATLPAFRAASLDGDAVVWREALLEGPWPRPLRGVDEALAAVERAVAAGDEVALWFDEDLFCRLHAAFFAHRFPGARLTNVLGTHGERRDLAPLVARRVPLDPALADAWRAYASPDPRPLAPLAQRFPWLRHHLERFPHVDDGLNALERRALEVLRDEGPLPFHALYPKVAQGAFSAASYGLGDAELDRTLAELGPLVARGERVGIAHEGREVLAGRADRADHAPLDRWLGGVHLVGRGAWRYDGERIVPHAPSS